ncbi:hypothetical protein D9M71_247170 [compost metagenome]
MPSFDTGFVALVLEGGADFAVCDFAMLVVGVAGIEFQRGERAVQVAQFRSKGVVVLLHAQAYVLFGWRSVVGVVATVGQTRVAILPGIRPTQRTAVLAAVAVAQAMLAVVVVIASGVGALGVTGDAQVVEGARVGIQVQGEPAVAGFQLARAAACCVGAAIAQLAGTLNAVYGLGRDAVIESIDHATDGIAPIEQGGGATDDLDALDVDRVQWHCVIIGQRRGVQCTDPVAQQADTVAIEPANDRAAGAGAEPGRGHAGLLVQGFAQAGFLFEGQVIAFQHTPGRCQLRAVQGVGGNDLGLQFKGHGQR